MLKTTRYVKPQLYCFLHILFCLLFPINVFSENIYQDGNDKSNAYVYKQLDGKLPFELQISTPNTIYEIRDSFCLMQNHPFVMPENCILKFEGGKISNGTLVLNNTKIVSENRYRVFECKVGGTSKSGNIYPEWFMCSSIDNATNAFQISIDIASQNGDTVLLTAKEYLVTADIIKLKNNVTLRSNVQSRLYTDGMVGYYSMLSTKQGAKNVLIDGIHFDQTNEIKNTSDILKQFYCIKINGCINTTIKNCLFNSVGRNTIKSSSDCNYFTVTGNKIYFRYREGFLYDDKDNGYAYDNSSIFVNSSNHVVRDNLFWGYDRIGTAIESHGKCGDISNNIAYNCRNFLHIVQNNTDNMVVQNEYSKTIIGNKVEACHYFITFWMPVREAMKNIVIKNNTAKCISGVIRTATVANEAAYAVENVTIQNNEFEGVYREFKKKSKYCNIDVAAAIRLSAQQDWKNILIENNKFKGFSALISLGKSFIGSYTKGNDKLLRKEHVYDVQFSDNKCLDCFNGKYELSQRDPHAHFFGMISLRGKGILKFIGNTIDFADNIEMPPVLISCKSKYSDIVFEKNVFPRNKTALINNDRETNLRIETDFFRINPRVFKKEPLTLIPGDRIETKNSKKKVLSGGTNKKGSFNSLKLKGWQNILYFESSEMSRACDIGDFISVAGILKSSSHKIIARVVAIVGDMVYVRCDSNGITPSLGNLCDVTFATPK